MLIDRDRKEGFVVLNSGERNKNGPEDEVQAAEGQNVDARGSILHGKEESG